MTTMMGIVKMPTMANHSSGLNMFFFSMYSRYHSAAKTQGIFLFLFFYFFHLTRDLARILRSMLRKLFIFKHLQKTAGRAVVSR